MWEEELEPGTCTVMSREEPEALNLISLHSYTTTQCCHVRCVTTNHGERDALKSNEVEKLLPFRVKSKA